MQGWRAGVACRGGVQVAATFAGVCSLQPHLQEHWNSGVGDGKWRTYENRTYEAQGLNIVSPAGAP